MTASNIRMGSTTYSFNDEFHSYELSLDGVFETIGALGPSQGIELIGPQCIRTFPVVSAEFEYGFKRAVDRYGLVPSAFGHYSDLGRLTGRNMTPEQEVEFSRLQLEGAKRLGFPLARLSYQHFDPATIEQSLYRRLLPDAERLGIKLAIEIHAPNYVGSAPLQVMIDDIKELGSPLVGFTLDCGSMTSCVSPVCIQKFLDLGVPEENVRRLTDLWTTKPTLQQLMAEVNEIDGGPLVELLAVETWVYFGHGNPADLREAMPYIFHVHGKFFHVDDNGMDDAVRYPEIIDVLVETGYDGFISSEYEGHHWLKDKNAAGQVRAHQQYLQRLIDQSEARLSPVSAQT